MNLAQAIDKKEASSWVVACGGNEPVMTIKGQQVQYMWNTFTKQHAYYSLSQDKFLDNGDLNQLGLI